ncbi:dullard-like phosphatase domain containing protein [Tieghemostelium lacteum]|uniref:Dullard-like phosphatase domain containing protein n=1 Tax=Tieghemostelium lacteum TaxID=361077 RepID=A0A151ZIA7_TIELA|nr:dullard-like phosphatase domain containing protein [Tieghemostelium lacteum]|eukprot:KYQ93731.1 dullard-like phosphatase domain containing protein [Tieghemostelium lacteum]
MEECPSIAAQCDQVESIEKVSPTIVSTKPVDPSMNFVYHWMLSVMTSFLSINNNDKDKKKDVFSENNNNTLKNITLSVNKEENQEDKENINQNIQKSTSKQTKQNNKQITTTTSKKTSSPKITNEQQLNSNYSIFNPNFLLSKPSSKKTLILDLDETLVHSTLKPITHHHLTVNVVIEDVDCTFYVIKRPHVDTFLEKVCEWYDLVVFTASMQQYADPLLDQLDTGKTLKKRLFRDSCLEKDGNFVKDLTMINQDLTSTIIIDNSPIAYSNNIENAIPIDTFIGEDPNDRSLLNLLPFLEVLRYVNDVRSILSLRG